MKTDFISLLVFSRVKKNGVVGKLLNLLTNPTVLLCRRDTHFFKSIQRTAKIEKNESREGFPSPPTFYPKSKGMVLTLMCQPFPVSS